MPSWTASDGTVLAYDVAGSGPPLVLVHGITESHHNWDPLLPSLAARHTVLTTDLRGHGRSGRAAPYDLATFAADVHAVVTHVGLGDDVVMVGHSLGGLVVTAYAAAFPCRGAVNVDQSLDVAGLQEVLGQLAPLLRGDEATFSGTVAAVFETLWGALPEGEKARIRSIRSPEQAVVLGVWNLLIDTPPDQLEQMIRSIASGVKVPYLSLHGIDPGPCYDAWLRDRIPTAIVEVWPDLGHYPHLVEPVSFLDRLAAFTASLS